MSITTDRDVFLGGHVTFDAKESFRRLAANRGKSMSELLSDLIEEFIMVAEDNTEPAPSRFREEDVPLPFPTEH